MLFPVTCVTAAPTQVVGGIKVGRNVNTLVWLLGIWLGNAAKVNMLYMTRRLLIDML